jgi:hypothetical protein
MVEWVCGVQESALVEKDRREREREVRGAATRFPYILHKIGMNLVLLLPTTRRQEGEVLL